MLRVVIVAVSHSIATANVIWDVLDIRDIWRFESSQPSQAPAAKRLRPSQHRYLGVAGGVLPKFSGSPIPARRSGPQNSRCLCDVGCNGVHQCRRLPSRRLIGRSIRPKDYNIARWLSGAGIG